MRRYVANRGDDVCGACFRTMAQTTLIRARGTFFAYSFTTGVKPIAPKVRMTDDAIQALCLWLVNQGRDEEAERLLEKFYPRT